MPETDKETQERLATQSMRIASVSTQAALLDQRISSLEKLVETYHRRIHELEDKIIGIKVVQEIHDVEIKGTKKLLQGNGNRDSIPMDLARLDMNIQNILKVDWGAMKNETEDLKEWKDRVDARAWQIAAGFILLIIGQIWQWLVK
jgi:hypothetical protein